MNELFEQWWSQHGDHHGDNKEIERRAFLAGYKQAIDDIESIEGNE